MTKRNSKRPKIQRTSVIDQVYEALKEDIINGVWKEGEKIPSEGELADYFGVNRLSVRMALQKLNTLAFVETQTGKGTFVSKFSLRPVFEEIAPMYSDEENRKDVQQLRNLLEGECTNLAIQHASKEQIAKLKEVLDNYNRIMDEYHKNIEDMDLLDMVVKADFSFHYEIIKMSGNRVYMDVYQMVENIISDHIRHLVYKRSHEIKLEDISMYSHDEIYNSILNGDPEKAKDIREKMLGIVPYFRIENGISD